MTEPIDYEPCLPLISILVGSVETLASTCRKLASTWEDFSLLAPEFLFDETDYYADEMGEPLFRWWGYRKNLADPSELAEWKLTTDEIEDEFRGEHGNRTVNIDPGYLDLGLLVLASHKNHHQKIFLGDGVYADPILEYVNGDYRPFHWSFPDFQDDRYYSLFTEIREQYKKLRKP